MPWKHVYDPTKGLITSRPATGIPAEASPYLHGVYLKDGEVKSDYGMTNFPEPGLLKTNALLGTLMSLDQFYLLNGVSYLLAFTTKHVYYLNETSGTWDVVTMGILIDDCEAAWTAGSNVTSTADTSVKLRGSKSAKHVLNAEENVLNGTMEAWAGGASAAPDSWVLTGAGASVAREATIIKTGTYSVNVTRSGATTLLYQTISTTRGIAYWRGKTVTVGCWVYADAPTRGRIKIDDGVTQTTSSYHSGTPGWEYLTHTIVVSLSALALNVSLYVSNTDGSVYFDVASVIEGHTGTGIVSSFGFGAKDLSAATNTHLSFWIYSTVSQASDIFRLRLSEQASGGTGATYADYTIPALVAGAWQHISLPIATPVAASAGTFPTDLNATVSVALVANAATGVGTVYIDDIRTTKEFTGDEDNRFSVTTQNDTFIVTNGVDAPTKITSGPTHAALTLTLPSGAITTSEVVLAFKDHVLYMNNTENGADCPQRVSWTNIGTIDDHLLGTAGFQDLIDDSSWIIGASVLSDNEIAIYKEWSIVQCTWVGGHTPFRFRTLLPVTGIVGKDAMADGDSKSLVMSRTNLYFYDGTEKIEPIDDNMKKTFFNDLNETYSNRTFIIDNREDDEYQIWIPTNDTTPTDGWCYNLLDKTWYIRSKAISGFGFYKQQSSLTIGDLVGTIGEQHWTFGSQLVKADSPIIVVGDTAGKVYKLNKLTLNNAGVAITNDFETPDFSLPDQPEYLNKYMRVSQMAFEAYGQSVTIHWSDDEGATWNVTQGNGENTVTLDSTSKDYQQYFEASVKKIRFRFRNTSLSSGYNLRYFGFFYEVKTGRR